MNLRWLNRKLLFIIFYLILFYLVIIGNNKLLRDLGLCISCGFITFKLILLNIVLIIPVVVLVWFSFTKLKVGEDVHKVFSEKINVWEVLGVLVVIALLVFLIDWRFEQHTFQKEIKSAMVGGKELKVVFDKERVADILNIFWGQEKGREFVACLEGEYYPKLYTFYISGFYSPTFAISSESDTVYSGCSGVRAIGTVHSQPNEDVFLSKADVYDYGSQNHKLICVMIGVDEFYCYVFYDLENPIKAKVATLNVTQI